jgi:hypothetical protein
MPDILVSCVTPDLLNHVARDWSPPARDPDHLTSFEAASARLSRWDTGATIRVAFNGGDASLHASIAGVAAEWTRHGNIHLDFGEVSQVEGYRQWRTTDHYAAAEIRVGFAAHGYGSLIGRQAIDPRFTNPGSPTIILGGMDRELPPDWQSIVLHAFGHALGLQHEHRPAGVCDKAFRWEDDKDYVPTVDASGAPAVDAMGRRPGVYSILGAAPMRWSRQRVDTNLRWLKPSAAFPSGTQSGTQIAEFDSNSIMRYHFPDWMFVAGVRSACYAEPIVVLSEEDRRRFNALYPFHSHATG